MFKRDDHPRTERVTVVATCRAVEAMLAPSCRTEVEILRPNGEPIAGNTHLRQVRAIPGRPTQDEKDAAEMRRQMVEEIRHLSMMTLDNLEEAIEDPHTVVVEGMMRALEDRYSAASVKDAVAKLRL